MQRKTPRIASEAYQKRICSECWHGDIGICGALLKQLYGIHQGVVGHMDITIHGFLECRCVKPLDQNRIPPDSVLLEYGARISVISLSKKQTFDIIPCHVARNAFIVILTSLNSVLYTMKSVFTASQVSPILQSRYSHILSMTESATSSFLRSFVIWGIVKQPIEACQPVFSGR